MIHKKKCTIFEKWKSLTACNFAAPWGIWKSGTFLEASNLTLFGARWSRGWQDFKSLEVALKNSCFIRVITKITSFLLQDTVRKLFISHFYILTLSACTFITSCTNYCFFEHLLDRLESIGTISENVVNTLQLYSKVEVLRDC